MEDRGRLLSPVVLEPLDGEIDLVSVLLVHLLPLVLRLRMVFEVRERFPRLSLLLLVEPLEFGAEWVFGVSVKAGSFDDLHLLLKLRIILSRSWDHLALLSESLVFGDVRLSRVADVGQPERTIAI